MSLGARASLPIVPLLWCIVASASAAEPAPLRVAVMPFDTVADETGLATLGQGLQAMLTTDLASAPSLQLVERDKLAAIRSELALSRTAAIDKATAVKVGRLLGASHLLTGQVTIVGKTMRLDARLVDAATGEVMYADKIEGERELFFELEKALAHKLVAALGAPLNPKERARLAKIHTADFDAFRRFSDGIEAFDQQAFDDAKKALREALERDQEFVLARLTLDDYEAIIARLEARSELLERAERDAKHQAETAQASEQQAILRRLFELSASPDPAIRLPALYGLTRWHDRRDAYRGVLLHASADAFLIARTRDNLVHAYLAEAEKAFPKVALFGTRDFIGPPPFEAKDFEAEQRDWLDRFFGTRKHQQVAQFRLSLLEDLERGVSSREHARCLHLDVRAEARFAERIFKVGMTLDPDALGAPFGKGTSWRRSFARTIGVRFREAGLFDESTRWFAEAGRAAEDPGRALWAAEDVQKNRDAVAFLAAHPSSRVREWMMMRRYDVPTDRWELETVAALEDKVLGPKGRSILANARELRVSRDEPYVLLGERPLYPLPGSFFATGRRTDPLAASDLDYYRAPSRAALEDNEWWLAIFDGQQQGTLGAHFALGYAPEGEWWHASLSSQATSLGESGYVEARPEVVFLFGLEDIEVPLVPDPAERNAQRLQRGLSGFGLRIGQDRIEIVAVSEPEVRTGYSVARYRLQLTAIASEEGTVRDAAKVTLSVRGREVTAKVGGLSVDARLPRAPSGFAGFAVKGVGHVALVGPTVTLGR